MTTRASREIRRIMNTLTDAIVEHRLPPGAQLTEAKLVEALDANRNHVRAALQKLASETKIVALIPNRGAFVAMPTADEATQVFHVRRILEQAIVEGVICNLTARNKSRLINQVEREREAIISQERQQMIRDSGNFHRLLGNISGNKILAEMNDTLIARTSLIIALYQETPDVKCSIGEHQAVMQALFAGDESQAVRLMEEHLAHIQRNLLLDCHSREVDLIGALKPS
jgi:DNA-binding GntR family transcriptional regulator